MDISLANSLPHRPPFLFVDRVVEQTGDRIVTTVRADPDWPVFGGHYPGNPLMPGVLVCECAFQAGAILLAARSRGSGGVPVLTRIKEAKFKQTVRPGQTLNVEVSVDDDLGDAVFMTGRITVDAKMAARVEFACAMTDK